MVKQTKPRGCNMKMPNFMIIGAAKAGTTALYKYLEEHPQIFMSPQKEPRFFALEGEKIDFRGPGAMTRFRYVTDIETYRLLFKNVSNELAIGEASTWYLYIPKAAKGIRHYLPNVKLIVMLRDPVQRAYSNFLGLRREGVEPLEDFTEAMVAEKERMENNWSPTWHYQQKGFYYNQLKRYFELFEKSQIRIYLYEDLKANSTNVVQDIFGFLSVDDAFVADTSQKHNVSGIPRNKALHQFLNQSNPLRGFMHSFVPAKLRKRVKNNLINLNLQNKNQSLLPEIRKQFIEVYREDILKLQELIDRDLSQWLKV